MNAIPQSAEPNDTARETRIDICHTVTAEQFREQEPDWTFDAAVQWFLAVSRAA